jgi:hypothetical protein
MRPALDRKPARSHHAHPTISARAATVRAPAFLRAPLVTVNEEHRQVGKRPVEAFLKRVLALTEDQNWDAKRRLEVLQ